MVEKVSGEGVELDGGGGSRGWMLWAHHPTAWGVGRALKRSCGEGQSHAAARRTGGIHDSTT